MNNSHSLHQLEISLLSHVDTYVKHNSYVSSYFKLKKLFPHFRGCTAAGIQLLNTSDSPTVFSYSSTIERKAQSRIIGNFVLSIACDVAYANAAPLRKLLCDASAIKVANVPRGTRYPVDQSRASESLRVLVIHGQTSSPHED